MKRFCLALVAGTGTYALALASLDPLDLLLGAAVTAVLLWTLRGFLFGGRPRPLDRLAGRLVALPAFVLVVLRDIAVGTWQVARVVLHLEPLTRPGLVRIPIGERTPTGTAVTGLVVTLSPGEFLVDIDHDDGSILIHVLDASDPDAIRARFEQQYRRYQRPIVP